MSNGNKEKPAIFHVPCKHCGHEWNAPVTTNSLYICPECHQYAACQCEYGFYAITPCTVFVGTEQVAMIEGGPSYRLDSERFHIHQELQTGYKNLEVYKEAADIISRHLQT